MMYFGDSFGFWPFAPIFMAIFWIVAIWAFVLFVRWVARGGSGSGREEPSPPEKTPLEILKERYARGEITKKEFEQKRADLM